MKTAIGVPVYNEARFLEKTLTSIDGQADQIIICDNASDDGTETICRKFAESRPYVKYVRFMKNRGAGASFRSCLDLAETEYFMWVGGHDLLVPNYVSNLGAVLEKDSSVVLAYANALRLDASYRYEKFYYYDWSNLLMHENAAIRVAATIQLLEDCTIFHGLYRKNILDDYFSTFHKKISNGNIFIDHVILSYAALRGKMSLCGNCNYIRIEPREGQPLIEAWRRAIRALDPNLPDDPTIFPRSIYKGQKAILDVLKKFACADQEILSMSYEYLVERWASYFA